MLSREECEALAAACLDVRGHNATRGDAYWTRWQDDESWAMEFMACDAGYYLLNWPNDLQKPECIHCEGTNGSEGFWDASSLTDDEEAVWCPRLDQLLTLAASVQAARKDRWAMDGNFRLEFYGRRWGFGEARWEDIEGPGFGAPGYGDTPEAAVCAWLLAVAKESASV